MLGDRDGERLVGFHLDEQGDWVLSSAAGTGQHVRHRPPWEMSRGGVSEEGRRAHLRKVLRCVRCDEDVVMGRRKRVSDGAGLTRGDNAAAVL